MQIIFSFGPLRSNFVSWYSKTCAKRPKIVFKDQLSLNAGKSIAECSKGSILQYFRPSLSYHLSLRSLFCLFLSGRVTQVLLYIQSDNMFSYISTVLEKLSDYNNVHLLCL